MANLTCVHCGAPVSDYASRLAARLDMYPIHGLCLLAYGSGHNLFVDGHCSPWRPAAPCTRSAVAPTSDASGAA